MSGQAFVLGQEWKVSGDGGFGSSSKKSKTWDATVNVQISSLRVKGVDGHFCVYKDNPIAS